MHFQLRLFLLLEPELVGFSLDQKLLLCVDLPLLINLFVDFPHLLCNLELVLVPNGLQLGAQLFVFSVLDVKEIGEFPAVPVVLNSLQQVELLDRKGVHVLLLGKNLPFDLLPEPHTLVFVNFQLGFQFVDLGHASMLFELLELVVVGLRLLLSLPELATQRSDD